MSGFHKASVRDLAPVGVAGRHAGTTVAATAALAQLAGVVTFSTGGLGGVHRGAPDTYDESADLTTLASTPIVVVSGCAVVGGWLELSAYGWMTNASMTGRSRPLAQETLGLSRRAR